MRLRFLPYKIGSQGCKELAQAMGILRVRANGSFIPREDDRIINWGLSYNPWESLGIAFRGLNYPNFVKLACNKLSCFQELEQGLDKPECVPTYTTDIVTAQRWFDRYLNAFVYCRTLIESSGGRGITIAHNAYQLVPAPLYTLGIRCRREYRVHVFNSEVIDITRKARREDALDEADPLIRNHTNNWIFQRDGFSYPDGLTELAIDTVDTLNLHFGAVDIIAETNTGKLFVLEVNTAPGITGTTVEKYAENIRRYINELP